MSSSMFKSYALTFLTYFVTPYVSTESTYIEGQGTEITIPLEEFIPSEPQEVFWTVNEMESIFLGKKFRKNGLKHTEFTE